MARLMVATTLRSDYAEFHDENRATADALADRGLRPDLHPWHTGIDAWLDADLVLVRTTWDYPEHLAEFERWLDALDEAAIAVINPIPFLRWNLRKDYLLDLAAEGVAIVAVEPVAAGTTIAPSASRRVLKPRVGVGGVGARIIEAGTSVVADVDSILNPYLPRVQEGERSVFLVDGEPIRVFRKLPDGDDFRVHPQWGGKYLVEDDPDPAAGDAARRAYAAADRLTGGGLVYLRVDLLQDDEGRWLVLETEGLEPSLYPDIDLAVVEALAGAVSRRCPED